MNDTPKIIKVERKYSNNRWKFKPVKSSSKSGNKIASTRDSYNMWTIEPHTLVLVT